ncbi:unnamed protein product [Heligmosomoides polygyrus]|uniref:Saposin B-type domain-containing protein n=1 Tax=Heligmosomoides polygyrus TaxID=6339 RepID=A0A183FQ62_HELPZ|nr:unnamed protein product [Heligmosomoides polygyrus]
MRTALFLALCCVLFTLSMSDDEEAKKKNETETDAEDDDDDDDDDEDDDEDDYEDSADNDTFIDIEEDNVLCRTCRLVVAGIEKGVRKAEHFKKAVMEQCQDTDASFSVMMCNSFFHKDRFTTGRQIKCWATQHQPIGAFLDIAAHLPASLAVSSWLSACPECIEFT